MDTNLIIEGLKFMTLGMGTVFGFLIILIGLMNVMSILIHKFFPEPQPSAAPKKDAGADKKKIAAAITAAIAHHRS